MGRMWWLCSRTSLWAIPESASLLTLLDWSPPITPVSPSSPRHVPVSALEEAPP